ncbi:metallophosphoesterase family protein [Sphingomonas sp. LR60]|uniref:metallophosphoesterase family protein n=1 Tax=Sphingomonas sp. LR60 TaxID=3050233 RepID=UPI002FE25518
MSTTVSISLGIALVAGRKRVPSPATGKIALRTGLMVIRSSCWRRLSTGGRSGKQFDSMTIGVPRDRLSRACGRQASGLSTRSIPTSPVFAFSMLKKLFRSSRVVSGPAFAPEAGSRIYAIGDIHGCRFELEQLLEMIDADDAARGAAETTLIFLGDLVDRGPDSAGVIARLMQLAQERPRVRFLKGNHEELFLHALDGAKDALRMFCRVGGKETVLSYGVDSAEYDLARLPATGRAAGGAGAGRSPGVSRRVRGPDRLGRLCLRPCRGAAGRASGRAETQRPALDLARASSTIAVRIPR